MYTILGSDLRKIHDFEKTWYTVPEVYQELQNLTNVVVYSKTSDSWPVVLEWRDADDDKQDDIKENDDKK